jgi:hypothetical protein
LTVYQANYWKQHRKSLNEPVHNDSLLDPSSVENNQSLQSNSPPVNKTLKFTLFDYLLYKAKVNHVFDIISVGYLCL